MKPSHVFFRQNLLPAVIGSDDGSLEIFGRWQDWRRRNHGLLMNSIAAAPEKPAVLGWDILIPEASPTTNSSSTVHSHCRAGDPCGLCDG